MAEEIKVEKDVEEVRTLIKEIDSITGEVKKIESIWNAYHLSVPSKNIGDDEIGVIFKELLKIEYRATQDRTKFTPDLIGDGENSLKNGLFKSMSPEEQLDDPLEVARYNLRTSFETNLKLLLKKLNEIKDKSGQDEKTKDDYTNLIGILTTPEKIDTLLTLKDTDDTPDKIDTLLPLKDTDDHQQKKKTVTGFINNAKKLYDSGGKSDEYTPLERKNVTEYFKKSENKLEALFAPVKKSQELIATKVNDVISKLIDISSKYASLDTRIKKDILEKLKPKDIASKSEINIINRVTEIVDKFTEDHKIHSTITVVTGGARNKKKKVGGASKVDRNIIPSIFKDVYTNIDSLKTLSSELYKGLNRFSNPEMGDTSKGEDSLFNKLFEKYMKSKDDTIKKGDFVASTELINDLKSNDLYPDDVLKIDMRDKFVFIAVTLFMRIISLIIIETIIDKKIITRMDTAIFWYGITVTVFLIVFVVIVNFDSYKLRIIFNYVNFHIGYSTTFSYIFQLWLFGGMIYYIMLKINEEVISSATSDEDRARLKHKIQVISMITWFFLSIGVLLM